MNILEIENKRVVLNQALPVTFSYKKKLLKLSAYLEGILETQNHSIFQAYFTEYISLYLACLKEYTPWYLPPSVTEGIITQIEKVIAVNYAPQINQFLIGEKERLLSALKVLVKVLEGGAIEEINGNFHFPVIDTNRNEDDGVVLGILESISVTIKQIKGATENKFIVIPSEPVLEERIKKQIEDSWLVACKEAKNHVRKTGKYHEVIISFDKKEGYYEGNSLGIVLTLCFLRELHSFYNSRYQIKSRHSIALTGSLNEKGEIGPVSKKIIEDKVEIIFYSGTELFIVPVKDEQAAKQKCAELTKFYPNKTLKILGVADITDVINRRDIVEIKKQNLAKRSTKSILHNWKVSLLILFLLSAFSYFLIGDLDDNPASVMFDGKKLYVKNKSGKVLWNKNFLLTNEQVLDVNMHKRFYKVVDVNNDDKNEVILAAYPLREPKNSEDDGGILCLNNKGDLIWKYSFRKEVKTDRDTFTSKYTLSIVDTVSLNGIKTLVLYACHSIYYPFAFIQLAIKTGEKLPGELWHSGHLNSAMIKDLDNDGIPELIAGGCNNGFKRASVAIVKINQMDGILPSTKNYTFLNKKPAKYEKYILLPRSDYNRIYNYLNIIPAGNIFENKGERVIQIATEEGKDNSGNWIMYWFNYSFDSVGIIFGDQFVFDRDALINKGILQKPFTGTSEYHNIIRNSIDSVRYEEFVEEMKNSKK